MKSTLLIHVIKEIETPEKTVQIEEFITDLFVYTKQDDNDVFYHKSKNQMYAIDSISQKVSPISLNFREQQAKQLKKMFHQIDVRNEKGTEGRKVFIEGRGNMAVLNGEVKVSTFKGIENTANKEAYDLLSQSSLVNIDIEKNEVTQYVNVDINIQGKRVVNKTTIKNISILDQDINRYDYLLGYPVN